MKTPEQIATDALKGRSLTREIIREDVWELIRDAVNADRAQHRTLVVIAHRETWVNPDEAEVLDADRLLGFAEVDDTAEEVKAVVDKLRQHGWDSIADDIEMAEKERRA